MGTLEVPADALWGAQTQRAIDNFPISGQAMPVAFIRALLLVKAAAAEANHRLGGMSEARAEAIVHAAESLLADDALMKHFPVDVFQTGSGTSSNMNVNEVLATLAGRRLGEAVSPNDDVNRGQSSNDVVPSAIHVGAALALERQLLPALSHLRATLDVRAAALDDIVKTGRTHLMDAMPVRLSQSLLGWSGQIAQDIALLESIRTPLQTLAQGGTAVGTGVNAPAGFATAVAERLTARTGIPFEAAQNPFTRIASQDTAVALSGLLKTTAVTIMKIANDLRWMNSGPLAGLGEISLESLQPGSSNMPGKVNPVIPEAAAMVAAQVIGNDATITLAGQSGNFELNVMLPVIARNLLESIDLLANVSRVLADRAVATFTVNEDVLAEALTRNPILVTALNPVIGYLKAAEIAKRAYREKRPVIDVAAEETGLPRTELESLLDPARLTRPG